jgi:hypothetical protein
LPHNGPKPSIPNPESQFPKLAISERVVDDDAIPTPNQNLSPQNFAQTLGAEDGVLRTPADGGVGDGVANLFCLPDCVARGTVKGLRGVTSFAYFTHGGESYLAVAQSVCGMSQPNAECADSYTQPRSAILQWNRHEQRFSEMLPLPDADAVILRGEPLPGHLLADHRRSLRLSAGRAMSFLFAELSSGTPVLIAASLTEGVVQYPWEFDRITGLRGVVDATIPPRTSGDAGGGGGGVDQVYFVGRHDASLVHVSATATVDSTGHIASQLQWVKTFSEKPASLQGSFTAAAGLAQAYRLSSDSLSGNVLVHGSSPRDELRCGPIPPYNPLPASNRYPLPRCQNAAFTLIGGSSLVLGQLLASPITGDMELTLKPESDGVATVAMSLADNLGALSRGGSSIKLSVVPVNQRPSFTAVPNVAMQAGSGVGTAIFTSGAVRKGGANEAWQVLSFACAFTGGDRLFSEPPQCLVEGNSGVIRGTLIAGAYGAASFRVSLTDSGPGGDCDSGGDCNVSPAQTFKVDGAPSPRQHITKSQVQIPVPSFASPRHREPEPSVVDHAS